MTDPIVTSILLGLYVGVARDGHRIAAVETRFAHGLVRARAGDADCEQDDLGRGERDLGEVRPGEERRGRRLDRDLVGHARDEVLANLAEIRARVAVSEDARRTLVEHIGATVWYEGIRGTDVVYAKSWGAPKRGAGSPPEGSR